MRRFRAVLLVLILVALAVPASAHHPTSPARHLGFIHYGGYGPIGEWTMGEYDEDFCVDVSSSSMTYSTAYDRITTTLYGTNDSMDWDDLLPQGGKARVWWVPDTTQCNSIPSDQRQLVEVEFLVNDAGACGGYSCVYSYETYWDTNSGHWEYHYSDVTLKTNHIDYQTPPDMPYPNERWRHVINHEVGHVLGLSDPTENTCEPKTNGSVPVSVMHPPYDPYFCPSDRLIWPSAVDHDSVSKIIQMVDGYK